MKTTFYNEADERAAIFDAPGPNGQSAPLRPGITRAQAQRFFDRRNAVNSAHVRSTSGRTLTDEVDEMLTNNARYELLKSGAIVLFSADGNTSYTIRNRVTRDYVLVALNIGKLAKNW